ncbi:hypothetical protein IQ07DRAFT_674803 [Pyrenochaeta sp. DS3sAY3a]|nr:hypothetical protein IQ07DRAFT_674803 [Pyrenochaeta sp. DS3sAY3a]
MPENAAVRLENLDPLIIHAYLLQLRAITNEWERGLLVTHELHVQIDRVRDMLTPFVDNGVALLKELDICAHVRSFQDLDPPEDVDTILTDVNTKSASGVNLKLRLEALYNSIQPLERCHSLLSRAAIRISLLEHADLSPDRRPLRPTQTSDEEKFKVVHALLGEQFEKMSDTIDEQLDVCLRILQSLSDRIRVENRIRPNLAIAYNPPSAQDGSIADKVFRESKNEAVWKGREIDLWVQRREMEFFRTKLRVGILPTLGEAHRLLERAAQSFKRDVVRHRCSASRACRLEDWDH